MKSGIKKNLSVVALIICVTLSVSVLSACTVVSEGELYASVQSFSYDSETDTVTALIKISSEVKSEIIGKSEREIFRGSFYNDYSYRYSFEEGIWDKVKADAAASSELAQTLTDAGVDSIYNLNIQYVYLTEYKSVSANGKLSEAGNVKSYVWTFSDGDNVEIKLYQTVENRVAWYGLTIGIVLFAVIIITILVVVKKKKEEQNASDKK